METNKLWSTKKAIVLAAVCLMAGIGGGWLIHGPQAAAGRASAPAAALQASTVQAPDAKPPQLKEMADAKAAPLVQKLKSDPENPELLIGIGNIYYDAQQYAEATDYYNHALKIVPANAAVRTDMATAYWFLGKTDQSIAEFDRALSYEPNNPNALFNRGIAKWKGKQDGAGALADWQKLLAVAPNFPEKEQVQERIAEVKKQAAKP